MQTSATRIVIVRNPQGLHLRAAMAIGLTARPFESRIELVRGEQRVEATDWLQILSLAAEPGTQLVLEANGRDAAPALEALVRLFAENFGEE